MNERDPKELLQQLLSASGAATHPSTGALERHNSCAALDFEFCVKCGWQDKRGALHQVRFQPEHNLLEIHCGRCGYAWLEHPADHEAD